MDSAVEANPTLKNAKDSTIKGLQNAKESTTKGLAYMSQSVSGWFGGWGNKKQP